MKKDKTENIQNGYGKILGYGKCQNCGFKFKSWCEVCPQCGRITGVTKNGTQPLKFRLFGFAGGSIGCAILIIPSLGLLYLIITIIPSRYWFWVSLGLFLLNLLLGYLIPKKVIVLKQLINKKVEK